VATVDRLTIVSHDRFQEIIIDDANRPDSFIRTGVVIGKDFPRIIVVPKGDVTCGFTNFTVDVSGLHLQPVSGKILIQHLRDQARYLLVSGSGIVPENRLEDYLVRGLIDFDDIQYDDHAELLYNLAGQVVRHLNSYLGSEDDVLNATSKPS